MSKMSKSEVYSWRLSPALKAELEAAARAEKTNVSAVLERLVRDWLATRPLSEEEDAEQQRRLRERLLKAAGKFSADIGSATNERVREVMGEILMKKYRASQRRAPKRTR
jgi:Ribbon-helix-helix protein, copG family